MSLAISLTQSLVRAESVTPHKNDDAATLAKKTTALHQCFDLLEAELKPLGFICERVTFDEPGFPSIPNFYAIRAGKGKHLNFLGHVDVVPAGDVNAWTHPPFSGAIANGFVYGRGTSDMKGNIACYVEALKSVQTDLTLSLLIIGDEESYAVNGAPKMVKWLQAKGEKFDWCLVGEPSNPTELGQEIKNGRRGTVNVSGTVRGRQGHIAYVGQFDNPLNRLGTFIAAWSGRDLDQGNEFFAPSHLEVNIIDLPNRTTNLIPHSVKFGFNVRWNNLWTRESLEKKLRDICAEHLGDHELEFDFSGGVFFTPPSPFLSAIQESVREVTGKIPAATTHGGTSDGRFVVAICPNVVECGVTSESIHQVDERVRVKDLEDLTKIYAGLVKRIGASV